MADGINSRIETVPREVRMMFWHHLLDVGPIQIDTDLKSGGIISRWPDDGAEEGPRPCLALLRLSKSLVKEMEYALYSCNTYILTSETSITRFLEILQMHGRDRRHLLRDIQTGLAWHDICQARDACIDVDTELAMGRVDFEAMLNGDDNIHGIERSSDICDHRVRKDRFREHSWRRKLSQLAAGLNPQRLTLDLRQAYCDPSLCCSMETTAIAQLKYMAFKEGVPELRVLGLKGFAEVCPVEFHLIPLTAIRQHT